MAAALVGLVVGIVVGLTSMGGGALLTPALIYVLGVPPAMAVGSDVFIATLTKLIGGGAYALRKDVHWPIVGQLALGSIPGAIIGKNVLGLFHGGAVDRFIVYGLGGALILAAIFTVHRLLKKEDPDPKFPMPPMWLIVLFGFLTGFIVTVTSVGSGSLLMVALVRFVPIRLTRLVGTDLVHALILSAFATFLHSRTGWVDRDLAASVLVGSIPGVLIGARFARVMPNRPLRAVLATVLAIIGVALLIEGPKSPQSEPAGSNIAVIAAIAQVRR